MDVLGRAQGSVVSMAQTEVVDIPLDTVWCPLALEIVKRALDDDHRLLEARGECRMRRPL